MFGTKYKTTMESIKEALQESKENLLEYTTKKGLDSKWILEIEYRKTIHWLKEIFFRTEKTLMDLQAEELPNQKRIESVEKTYNRITFIYGAFNKMDARVKELEVENEMLKQKFEYFKQNYKK